MVPELRNQERCSTPAPKDAGQEGVLHDVLVSGFRRFRRLRVVIIIVVGLRGPRGLRV